MKLHKLALLAAVIITMATAVCAPAAEYRVSVIATGACAYGINNTNQVTGQLSSSPVIWDLNTGTYTVGNITGSGVAINDNGQVAVLNSSDPSTSYLWDGVSQPQQLPTLGGADCRAYAINNLGQIAGSSTATNGWYHPYLLDPSSGIIRINNDDSHNWAYGINDLSQVVGSITPDYYSELPYVWDAVNGMKVLPTLGGRSGQAFDINNSGMIAGTSSDGFGSRATIWDCEGNPTSLGLLDSWQSYGFAINNNGQVIGTLEYQDNPLTCPFIWDSENGIRKLPTPDGYQQCWISGINDAGWVVGFAQMGPEAGYRSDAILWTPVPEPSSIATLLFGTGGIGSLAIRRRR